MTNSDTPKILTLLDAYLPGYRAGGPITTIANVVEALGQEFSFCIITRDRDLGDTAPYPNLSCNQWLSLGRAKVFYTSHGFRGLLSIIQQLRRADDDVVLYLNSVFSFPFSILPLLLRRVGSCKVKRVLIAPRGEFSPAALDIHPIRKRFYLAVAGKLGLYDGVLWQASTETEMALIRRQLLRMLPDEESQAIFVAKNIASTPEAGTAIDSHSTPKHKKETGKLRVVFLARISPMKNLIGAISYFRGIKGEVEFSIYGPVEDAAYWDKCKIEIESLPSNIHTTYHGPVVPSQVHALLSEYDLLLLPTFGENFGHVISEAILASCPVLISDRTPWSDIEEYGAGWTVAISQPERFHAILQQLADANEHEYAALKQRVYAYKARLLRDTTTVEANRNLFRIASIAEATQMLA